MFLGVDHIGVGVSDMEAGRRFYGDLSFTEVAFDYTGPLPGLEAVAGRDVAEAHVVMLRSRNPTAVGLGAVKLVQVLDEPVPPMPKGIGWGELGICEVCVHVRDQPAFYQWLVDERGATSLMEPCDAPHQPPNDTHASLSYVADPEGGKIELIEWMHAKDWPENGGPHGVNHVAFGTYDIERSKAFYKKLGFTGLLFDSDDFFEPMDPWYAPRTPPKQHMMLLTNPYGAGLEPVQHDPPSPDMRGEWGHVGPMEFGVGVTNLDQACAELAAAGIETHSGPQSISLDEGSWLYAYFVDPDGLYVHLTETRY
jgi:catechol 2,3-dioxygenase-like lactoylglutathione lyase family enzyme